MTSPYAGFPVVEESNIIKMVEGRKLKEHIKALSIPIDQANQKINGFDVEFQYIEQATSKQVLTENFESANKPENRPKNRYTNILPTEKTRVKLSEIPGEAGSDYTNGNFIDGLITGEEKAYIACQGPLSNTLDDFWRMTWELEITVVVMLTKEVEGGRLKCDRYWPDSKDNVFELRRFKLELLEDNPGSELWIRKFNLIKKRNRRKKIDSSFPIFGLARSWTSSEYNCFFGFD